MWEDEDYCLSPTKSAAEWDSDRISGTFRHSVRGSSPLSLSDLDMWDNQGHSKAQSSTWYGMASVSGTGFLSKAIKRQSEPPGMRRWQSMSRLAPEGAPRSYSSSPGAELRAALEESGFRRAELVQRLRDAHGRLDSQTDFLKSKDTQLQYTTATSQVLDMKHKQLAQAVSALEQEKDAAELSRFEESQRRAELQDKVLKLEMEMLKMRSALQMGNICQPTPTQKGPSLLSRTLPVTQEDFYKEGRQKAERKLVNLREALKEAEGRAKALETEKDQALQQLHSSEERAVLVQSEQLNQRLSHTMQTNSDLQEQLSEARSKLGQACLERDLLSTNALRLEESVEDLKAKLSGSLSDKDRLLQDKVDLHQKAQGLELQLERAQQGRESYTNQVCELHDQLAEAKIHTNRHDQETVRVKEELLSVREVNDKLECELELVKQRLETSLREHHELTAERVIHANQIAALETERKQLIGEKEELLSSQYGRGQEVLAELNDTCCHLRKSQKTLESETQRLQEQCLCLEAEILEKEGEMELRDEEHQRKESAMAQNMEELRGVISHWTDKWQEVALKLQSTQRELEELQTNNPQKTMEEEAARLTDEVERLQAERQQDKKEIQDLLQHKANAEQAQSLQQMELDACKQELELERSRSQTLLCRQERGSSGDEYIQTLDKGTETEPNMPTESFFQEPSGSNNNQNDVPQVSVKEMDGKLGQEKTELQKVWDLLRIREGELEKQQQEVQSTRDQMSRQTVEVQRLEQELVQQEQNLRESEHALKSLERLTEVEKTETQIKISALELQLLKVREQPNGSSQNKTKDKDTLNIESLQGQLEESRRRATQLELERDQAVQRLQSLRQLPQGKLDKTPPESKQEKTPVDQEKQRRLVTEQLKTLFKEREQLVQACDTSAPAESGGHPLLDDGSTSKVVKTPSDALHSQRLKQQELQRERSRQKGTGLRPVSEEPEDDEDPHCQAGQEAEQATVAQLREELHDKSLMISAMSMDIINLKETNENLLKAKTKVQQRIQGMRVRVPQLRAMMTSETEVPSPSKSKGGDTPIYPDGIFLARQVEICSPDEDEEKGGD